MSSLLSTLIISSSFTFDAVDLLGRSAVRAFHLFTLYGPSSIFLFFFGNRATWRIEAQVLGQLKEEDATTFKKSILDECTMIAVAAAIVAQIAITGLSLDSLSQTHWVAQGAFVLSLTSSLMAVYYATTQQRMLGRLLQAEQVRLWIRGGNRAADTARLVPSLDGIVRMLRDRSMLGEQTLAEYQAQLEARQVRMEEARSNGQRDHTPKRPGYSTSDFLDPMSLYNIGWTPSDPADFNPTERDRRNLKKKHHRPMLHSKRIFRNHGFGSSDAPHYLALLPADWLCLNVFLTYITSLVASGLVYSISQLFQDDDKRTELAIMEDYLKEFVENNPEIVRNWGVRAEIVEGVLDFHSIESESSRGTATASGTEQNTRGNGSLYSIGIELGDLPAVEGGVGAGIVGGVPHFHYTEAHSSRATTSQIEQDRQENGSLYGRD
ncbi:hypothetical protein V501_03412 [Pseudogymnoascus sp. VKM F-4519 (FW-2642)]|nr:hypothetical protein V501_03412 [Pseudogymnoascus sp. VKM F-4519 (FW-2642)]